MLGIAQELPQDSVSLRGRFLRGFVDFAVVRGLHLR
jgi:hypothetical protein